jgi:hypothetical protein
MPQYPFPSSFRRLTLASIGWSAPIVIATAAAAALGGCPGPDPQTASAGGGGQTASSSSSSPSSSSPSSAASSGGGGNASMGDAGACDGGIVCNGQCMDPTSAENCGRCGVSCKGAMVQESQCVQGNCEVSCAPGFANATLPGQSASCLPAKRVFVTSLPFESFPSATQLGVQAATGYCQKVSSEADASGRWGAWVSTTGTPAAMSVLGSFDGAYVLMDKITVVATANEIRQGKPLRRAIDATESGMTLPPGQGGAVWTGTTVNGSAAGQDCSGWASATHQAVVGQWWKMDQNWTDSGSMECNAPQRLYCFEL